VPRAQFNDVVRGAAASVLAHAVLLVLIARAAAVHTPVVAAEEEQDAIAGGTASLSEASLAWVDLAPALLGETPPEAELPPAAVPGDENRMVALPVAPRRGTSTPAASPAADSGTGGGRPPVEASRRDLSTLRTRVADGARAYHGEHEQTGARASSPQPARQEPVVGVGDSARTRRPRAPDESAPSMELPAEAEGAAEAELRPADTDIRDDPDGKDRARGEGPLDADRGPRQFDTDTQGAARDDHWARAASDESHPGRLELSAPAAAGPDPGTAGHGPSDTPGAISGPSAGTAPSVTGAQEDVLRGPALALSTTERAYVRTQAEIRRRVASALRFPKQLALMLEQGETVVHFVVRPDGRLAGAVQVTKSAGFDEFDAAAVSAVNRAAPFPATGRALSVSMPIAFDNPLVR
jgi:TonB family protein